MQVSSVWMEDTAVVVSAGFSHKTDHWDMNGVKKEVQCNVMQNSGIMLGMVGGNTLGCITSIK